LKGEKVIMIKSRKLISVISALAMVISMFSAFTIAANAASDIALTLGISDEDKAKTQVGDEITLTFTLKNNLDEKAIWAVGFTIPEIDKDTFEIVEEDDGIGGESSITSTGFKHVMLATRAKDALSDGEYTINVKLKLKKALTDELDLTIKDLEITNETKDGVQTTYGNAASATQEAGIDTSNAVINKTVSPISLAVAVNNKTGNAAGDTLTLTFTLKNNLDTKAIWAVGFTISAIDKETFEIVDEDDGIGGESSITSTGFKHVMLATRAKDALSQSEYTINVNLKLLKDLTSDVALNITDLEITNEAKDGVQTTYGNAASATSKAEITNATIKVEEEAPATGKVYVKAGDAAEFTETSATVADGKATITLTAPEGKAIDSVTAADAAENGNELTVADNGDGTYTITMPATGDAYVTVTYKDAADDGDDDDDKNNNTTVYPLTLSMSKEGSTSIGNKYTVKLEKNSASEEEVTTADIVITIYNSSNVIIGYMVFNDAAVNTDYSFYLPSGSKAAANAVDNISEKSDDLGNLVATKVSKK
jgi:hypothetical protein